MTGTRFDLVVIGGGINGAAVARDAAGRGLSVMLAERGDYAAATSSASSKLIHGGLRYLESRQFSLVRDSLKERDVLLRIAPHLVSPLRFLVPVYAGAARPAWLLRLGLMLYDLLAGSAMLARSGALTARQTGALPHLERKGLKAVLHYADCQVDDARLVLSLLLDARARGADIANYREVLAIRPARDGHSVDIRDRQGERRVETRYIVNAAGPWANRVAALYDGPLPTLPLRLVRGSHILLAMPNPPFTDAMTLQMADGRVVFVIPWFDRRHVMVGTTDVPHEGDPAAAACSEAERDYLLAAFNRTFPQLGAGRADVLWSWAGVRPLIDDGADNPSKVTRDSRLLSTQTGAGGLVTIYGGKLTSHRKLAEKVMDRLAALGCAMGPAWTAGPVLPGGELDADALGNLALNGPCQWPLALRQRLCRTYGARARDIFSAAKGDSALISEIVPGIPLAELHHAMTCEDARTGEDFLYRRTKMFLDLTEAEINRVKDFFKSSKN